MSDLERPAFYALRGGGWRDWWSLLHPPYTLWHLSYVCLGAATAPHVKLDMLLWSLLAFFLAMGLGAHALDELNGRPLRTSIASTTLRGLAVASIAGAVAIGAILAPRIGWSAIPFIAFGSFIVAAYNLEWFGGRFHRDSWFAVSWGALPVLAGYVLQTNAISLAALLMALAMAMLSLVEIKASRPYKELRRAGVVDARSATLEAILKSVSLGVLALAAGMVAWRLYG